MGQRWFDRQLGLLGRPGPFRLISLAALGSGIGTWFAAVALQVDVFDRTHSAVWIAALVIVEFVPTIAVGLVFGPFVDRLSRRRLMIASDLARFGVFAALPFVDSALGIVVLAGVAGLAWSVFRPALFAGVPNLVEADELTSANSLLQAIDHGTTALAPPLAGLLVATQGPHLCYWVNAASFLLSAALLARVPASKLQTAVSATRGLLRDVGDGMRAVARSPQLMTVLLVWTTAILANGAINVSEIAFAKDSLDSGAFGFGLLAGGAGLGLALGSLLAAPWIDRRGVTTVYVSSFVLMAGGFGVAAVAPNVWVAVLCVIVSGIGNGAAVVCNFTYIGRGAADEVRGRTITLLMSATAVTFVVGTLVGGQVTDAVGARWVWGGAAAIYAVVGLLAVALAPRGAPERVAADASRP
jgi:MFS family permease